MVGSRSKHITQHIFRVVTVCVSVLIVLFLFTFLPVTYKDWIHTLRPAALNWRSPYQSGIFNPPWLFLILHPLTLLPPRVGAGLLMFLSMVVVAAYVGSPKKTLVVALSAPMVVLFTLGQVDALVLLGLMIPNGLGLPFLLMKPQGVFLATARRINGRSLIFTLVIILASVMVWGFWWQDIRGTPINAPYNVSFFPYSVVVGFILLYVGLKRNSDALLCLASLCFSPYFMITSMLPAVAAVILETDDKRWWTIAVLGSWLYLMVMKSS